MPKPDRQFFSLNRMDRLLAALAGLLSLALYARTLAPSLLYGDVAEFQTLSFTLGMTHSSGYPTQILVGKLFTLLPFGDIAYRVNLMSAVFGALAVANCYLVTRLLGGWRMAALAAAAALATSALFWRRTIIAESYGPAAGMVSLVWLMVLLWRGSGKAAWLFAAGLAGGLSLGIHSTVTMTGVSVLVYMLFSARRRKDWLAAGAGAALGLLLTLSFFFYLDHNDPPSSIYNTTYRTNLVERGLTPEDFDTPTGRLLAIFPTGGFSEYYFSAAPDVIKRRILEYGQSFPAWQIPVIGLGAVALFAIPRNGKHHWREALYALTAFLLIWTFAVSVEFSVYQEFFVPVAVFVHVWLGLGVCALLDAAAWVADRMWPGSPGAARAAANLCGLGLVVLTGWNVRTDLRLAVLQGTTSFIQSEKIYPRDAARATKEGQRILDQVEDDAILFASWDRLYSYVYTAHIIQGRTGIALHEVLSPPRPGTTTMEYIDANIDQRPIYFTVEMPELDAYYDVEQIDQLLYRLRKKMP